MKNNLYAAFFRNWQNRRASGGFAVFVRNPILCVLLSLLFDCGFLYARSVLDWPLQNTNIIKSGGNGWEDKFYGYRDSRIFVYSFDQEKIAENQIYTLSVTPDYVKVFPLIDAKIITAWSNRNKKLEYIVLDNADHVVENDTIILNDQVDDLDIKVGQGRRLAFLFLKESGNQNKASIWFDEREQTIFLQDTPFIAGLLQWSSLSSWVVTRSAMKSFIKVWQKGITNSYEIPFLPLAARFVLVNNNVTLLAIDSRGILWELHISDGKLHLNKLMDNPDLVFVKNLDINQDGAIFNIFLPSPFKKKIFIYKTTDIRQPPDAFNILERPMIGEDDIFPGKIAGKIAWLESNTARRVYINREGEKFLPFMDISWTVNIKEGFPQVSFAWKSFPQNKKYQYRYIIDTKENSPPLPEYRIFENKLIANLPSDGQFYLHIQAMDTASAQESIVYHIPVF